MLHIPLDKCNTFAKMEGSIGGGRIRAAGYVRISTNEDKQKYGKEVQVSAIEEYCSSKGYKLIDIYSDTQSGSTLGRPGIQDLISNKDKFQVVVVYKLDRLSRSVLDLLKLLKEELEGIEVVFLKDGIDQQTKEGRLLLNQLASFAEYERELIVSRIKDGLAEARKNGVRLGAKPKYKRYRSKVRKMRSQGVSWRSICRQLLARPCLYSM